MRNKNISSKARFKKRVKKVKWVLQATTSSRRMLRFRYCGKPSAEPPTKRTERSWTTNKNERLTANCAQSFVLKHHYCKSVVLVSWFSYRCCLFSYMRSLIHVVSSDDPRRRKGTWDCCCSCCCHLSLPWPYRKCALALYIVGDRQRWPSTFRAS